MSKRKLNKKSKAKKINHTRKPDIAFWFDEEDRYAVMVREDLSIKDYVAASFDLLVRAVKRELENKPQAEWDEEG